MQPREYQTYFYEEFFKEVKNGHKKIAIEAFTAVGKTKIASMISNDFIKQKQQVIFIVPRLTLLSQTQKSYKYITNAEIIQGTHTYDENKLMFVASLKTLVRRTFDNLNPSLIIIDEAHIGHEKNDQKKVLKKFPNSLFLFLSATCFDSYGKPFDAYDKIIRYKDILWYISKGYLSDIACYSPISPDLSKVSMLAGDYNEASLDRELNTSTIVSNVVGRTKDMLKEKKSIVFGITIAHSINLAKEFEKAGFKVKAYHSELTTKVREQILKDYHEDKLDMLTSVSTLAEGFDEPKINAILFARPTKSKSLYKQMVGRGMRLHPNGDICILIDCANVFSLGYPTDPVTETPRKELKIGKCKICNEKMYAISNKIKKIDNQILITIVYRCENGHEFTKEKYVSPVACPNCSFVFKDGCKFEETDTEYKVYYICPECNTEKNIRTLKKITAERFERIQSLTQTEEQIKEKIRHITKDKEYTERFINYINKLDVVNRKVCLIDLHNILIEHTDLSNIKTLLKNSIISRCCKTNNFNNLGGDLLKQCLEKTNDSSNLVNIYNLISNKSMKDSWKTKTLQRLRDLISNYPDDRNFIFKSIQTRCKNILSNQGKMAQLYYFMDFLENKIKEKDERGNG